MALWITFKDGTIKKYNEARYYTTGDVWITVSVSEASAEKNVSICRHRASEVSSLEFEQPCEVTFKPDVIATSIDILMKRAKKITDWETKGKLADLARMLRDFNPQRRTWK